MSVSPKHKPTFDYTATSAAICSDYEQFLQNFMHNTDLNDAAVFTARHAAGRAALAHLEQVVRLRRLEEGEATPIDAYSQLSDWRAQMPPPLEEEPLVDDSASDD